MNTTENTLQSEQGAPISLDDKAGDHYWRVVHLRDLLAHLEEFALNEVPPDIGGRGALQAMIFSAVGMASAASEEADRFMVKENESGRCLVDAPVEMLSEPKVTFRIAELERLRAALRNVTRKKNVEDLTSILEDVYDLTLANETYAEDMGSIVGIIRMHGYELGWATDQDGKRRPTLTPSLAMLRKQENIAKHAHQLQAIMMSLQDSQEDEALDAGIQAFMEAALLNEGIDGPLTREDIHAASQAFRVGLEKYLATAATKLDTDTLVTQTMGAEHEPA